MAFQENTFILQFNPAGILLGLRHYPETDNYFWSDDSVLDYNNYGEWVFELSNLLAVRFPKCELRPLLKERVQISLILFFLTSFFRCLNRCRCKWWNIFFQWNKVLRPLHVKCLLADGFVEYREYFGYCAQSVGGKRTNAECNSDKLSFMCKQKGTAFKISFADFFVKRHSLEAVLQG